MTGKEHTYKSPLDLCLALIIRTQPQLTRVADMPNRRRLRSASSNQLDVPSFRLPTVGSRAFPTAGAKVWNSLPDDVTSAPSLSTFRRH